MSRGSSGNLALPVARLDWTKLPVMFLRMSVEQMQREVGKLPEGERRKFAAWLLAKYPPRAVGDLVSRAETQARQGKWVPQPPGRDNIPSGNALAKAVGRAKALGLEK